MFVFFQWLRMKGTIYQERERERKKDIPSESHIGMKYR